MGTIAGNVVLTASRCVTTSVAGHLRVDTWGEKNIKVARVEVHGHMDAALLWLESNHTAPTDLYLSTRELSIGDDVRVSGFGAAENKRCGLRNFDSMNVISCDDSFSGNLSCPNNPSRGYACVCSGPSSGEAVCGGDLGGPWYRSNNNKTYIVGVRTPLPPLFEDVARRLAPHPDAPP